MTQVKAAWSESIYLSAPTRTAMGKFGGQLKGFAPAELATRTLKECMQRLGEAPASWVLLGHARQAGAGPNPARQAAVWAGLGEQTPAITLNQACASGMTAVFSAVEKILSKSAQSVFAGGVECMSRTPYLLPAVRWGMRLGHGKALDGMYEDGFHCRLADCIMGETVEKFIAQELGVSRDAQDAFALLSHHRAQAAWERGDFNPEVFGVQVAGGQVFEQDEIWRQNLTLDKLKALPPAFDSAGSLTAGNSSALSDGAAFVHVGTQKKGACARVLGMSSVALDPRRMGLGPVPAIEALLKEHRLSIQDVEAFEINEAFAAQVLACNEKLKIDEAKLNAWGGAIALGHPIGASGARIVVTLLSRLRDKPGALGIAALCVSGGQGPALLVERL